MLWVHRITVDPSCPREEAVRRISLVLQNGSEIEPSDEYTADLLKEAQSISVKPSYATLMEQGLGTDTAQKRGYVP